MTTFYHGTDTEWTTFNFDMFGSNGFDNISEVSDNYTRAAYATSSYEHAKCYGNTVIKVEAKGSIKKVDRSAELVEWAEEMGYETVQQMIDDYYNGDAYEAVNFDQAVEEEIKNAIKEGFDGVIVSFGDICHNGMEIGETLVATNMQAV